MEAESARARRNSQRVVAGGGEVARRDGVNRTATALHLDGGKLKRRMVAADSAPGVRKGHTTSLCGTDGPACKQPTRVHHRTGVPARQVANPLERRHGGRSR